MRFVRSFIRFWYDFIVGDDWRVAVGVVITVAICSILVSIGSVETSIIAALFFLGVLASLLATLFAERAKVRRR